MAAAFSTSRSSSITYRLASAAAIARSFWPNVLLWTTHRSIELKTQSITFGLVMTAPTGTYPPESALATQTMSGSTSGPVLEREPLAGPAQAALDLVADQQAAVLVAQPLGLGQVPVGDHLAALALHRLDDERGRLLGRQRLLQRRQVVERHLGRARRHRAEPLAEELGPVHGQRARPSARGRRGRSRPRPAGRSRTGRTSGPSRPTPCRCCRRTPGSARRSCGRSASRPPAR